MDNTIYYSWGLEVFYSSGTSKTEPWIQNLVFFHYYTGGNKYFVLQKKSGLYCFEFLKRFWFRSCVYYSQYTDSSWLQRVGTGDDFVVLLIKGFSFVFSCGICTQFGLVDTFEGAGNWICFAWCLAQWISLPLTVHHFKLFTVQWYHSFFKAQRLFAQVHETFTDSMTLLFRHWNWFLPALNYSMGSNE